MKGLHNRSIKQETVVKLFDLAMGVRKIDKYYERIEVYLLCHSMIIIVYVICILCFARYRHPRCQWQMEASSMPLKII